MSRITRFSHPVAMQTIVGSIYNHSNFSAVNKALSSGFVITALLHCTAPGPLPGFFHPPIVRVACYSFRFVNCHANRVEFRCSAATSFREKKQQSD